MGIDEDQVPSGYRTKSDIAYSTLKAAIVGGQYAPRAALNVRELAGQMGISEIPVREAIQRLDLEGLVRINPHQSPTVADLPLEGLIENLMIRSVLERLAGESATGNLPDDRIQQLEQIVNDMDACIEQGKLDVFGTLNRKFHFLIYSAAPYPQLSELIETLWNRVPRARSVFMVAPQLAKRSQDDHKAILVALKEGRAADVGELIRRHKTNAADVILSLLSAQSQPDLSPEKR